MYHSTRIYLLPVIFTLAITSVFGQRDSLEQLLGTTSSVQKRAEIYYELFKIDLDRNNEQALRYATLSYELANEAGDKLGVAKAANAMGWLLKELGNVRESVRILLIAEEVAKSGGYRDQQKFVLNNLALAYTREAAYDKALEVNFRSLELREEDGDYEGMSVAYNSLGLCYYSLKDFNNALRYFKLSYDFKKEYGIMYDYERSLINLALAEIGLNHFSNALEWLQEAQEYCNRKSCDTKTLLELRSSMAEAYFGIGDFARAITETNVSLELAHALDFARYIVGNYNLLAKIHLEKGENDLVLECLDKAYEVAENTSLADFMLENHKIHAELYLRAKNYERASHYQGLYNELRDSIYHSDLIRNISNAQTQYEERENTRTIRERDQKIAQQNKLNIAISVIALLAGLLIFVLYRTNTVTKRVNEALSVAKEMIEDQNRQLKSMNQVLEERVKLRTKELSVSNDSLKRVNDELDNFIYKTSHDIRGPLASLKGICNVALIDVKDEKALDYLQKLDLTAERLNGILTRLLIINQINHASLNNVQIDFVRLVDEILIVEQKKGFPDKIEIRKVIDADILFYSDGELVRIILENLIDNALKFHNDSNRIKPFVEINIQVIEGDLHIRVIDNGIGVSATDPEKIFQMFNRGSERSETGGIGLYLTKTAADKIGGKVGLRTTQEGYTEFYVTFPYYVQVMAKA